MYLTDLLEYRHSDYFEEGIHYILQDTGTKKLWVTKCEHSKGSWFSTSGLCWKMTSVRVLELDSLGGYQCFVEFPNVEEKFPAILSKCLEPYDIGFCFNNNPLFKKYGLPTFWNDVNEVNISLNF